MSIQLNLKFWVSNQTKKFLVKNILEAILLDKQHIKA